MPFGITLIFRSALYTLTSIQLCILLYIVFLTCKVIGRWVGTEDYVNNVNMKDY